MTKYKLMENGKCCRIHMRHMDFRNPEKDEGGNFYWGASYGTIVLLVENITSLGITIQLDDTWKDEMPSPKEAYIFKEKFRNKAST